MSTRAAFVKHLFQGLRWYEASEYALLMLFIVSISIQWHIALWCLILLCANTLIKIIVTRHIGNPALNRPTRVCLGLMMLFYIVYAISGTYSSQPDEALSTASMMLPLLLFPCCSSSATHATSTPVGSQPSPTCLPPHSPYALSSCSSARHSTQPTASFSPAPPALLPPFWFKQHPY